MGGFEPPKPPLSLRHCLDVNTVSASTCKSVKISGFFCDSLKIFCCNPPSNFHGRQTLMCFTSLENFVNFGP